MSNPFPGLNHLLKYQDLFLVFVWRNFNIRYRQSVLGVVWAIFPPLSMMVLFTVVFGKIMSIKVSSYPAPLFFYTGLLFWSFFSSALNFTIPILTSHYNLITKIYFPKEILPFSGIALALVDLAIASGMLVFMLVFFKQSLTPYALWIFPLVLILILFTIAASLFLSALNVFYRDVQLASGFLIQLWFFMTPVFYSVDKVSVNMKVLFFLNPLTFIIENSRRCLFEGRPVVLWQYLLMFIFVLIALKLSYAFFTKMEKRFADVI